jgi:hypothetical protein
LDFEDQPLPRRACLVTDKGKGVYIIYVPRDCHICSAQLLKAKGAADLNSIILKLKKTGDIRCGGQKSQEQESLAKRLGWNSIASMT